MSQKVMLSQSKISADRQTVPHGSWAKEWGRNKESQHMREGDAYYVSQRKCILDINTIVQTNFTMPNHNSTCTVS
jgi:lipopolysaccharide/colanic/teichoic acid biosynthesis glycosyltransferase